MNLFGVDFIVCNQKIHTTLKEMVYEKKYNGMFNNILHHVTCSCYCTSSGSVS